MDKKPGNGFPNFPVKIFSNNDILRIDVTKLHSLIEIVRTVFEKKLSCKIKKFHTINEFAIKKKKKYKKIPNEYPIRTKCTQIDKKPGKGFPIFPVKICSSLDVTQSHRNR